MDKKQKALDILNEKKAMITGLADRIWDYAETGNKEFRSSEDICAVLEKEGFTLTRAAGGIETAFRAEFGSGRPVVGIMGEYDALEGMSQLSGVARKEAIEEGMPGHGCGHNQIATAALAGVLAAKAYLEDTGKSGTIVYFGCPAEEGGICKVHMVHAGLFDDVDIAMTSHPATANYARSGSTSANTTAIYTFHGKSAHPAAAPHQGRSALDALELLNIGANFLREHIPQGTYICYSILNAGSKASNVIPDFAQGQYETRASSLADAMELHRRVDLCAEGAATMTETRLEKRLILAGNNKIPNSVIEKVLYQNFSGTPLPVYTDEELEFAQELYSTLDTPEQARDFAATLAPEWRSLLEEYQQSNPNSPFNNFLLPHVTNEIVCPGASDVGDVAWICPTSEIGMASIPKKMALHSWQVTALGKSGITHKNILLAGHVLGGAAIDFFADPALADEARKEHTRRRNGRPYISPVDVADK